MNDKINRNAYFNKQNENKTLMIMYVTDNSYAINPHLSWASMIKNLSLLIATGSIAPYLKFGIAVQTDNLTHLVYE